MADCLMNAMYNPVYVLLAGALQRLVGTKVPQPEQATTETFPLPDPKRDAKRGRRLFRTTSLW
jgi:hypothetical protein